MEATAEFHSNRTLAERLNAACPGETAESLPRLLAVMQEKLDWFETIRANHPSLCGEEVWPAKLEKLTDSQFRRLAGQAWSARCSAESLATHKREAAAKRELLPWIGGIS